MNRSYRLGVGFMVFAVAAGLVCEAAQAQLGARKEADVRVQQALDAIGWKYNVDPDGDYVLCFGFESPEQAQIVFVGSRTSTLGTLEIREVFAPGIVSESPLEPEVLGELLAENCKVKVGAWRLEKGPRHQVALFAAHVAADTDPRDLATIVEMVAFMAHKRRESRAGGVQTEGRGRAKPAAPSAVRRPLMAANWSPRNSTGGAILQRPRGLPGIC